MDYSLPGDDKFLFQRIAVGDENAFKELFRKYIIQLRPVVYGITQSDTLVDEIIQETLIKVWLNRDKLPQIENPRAWICRVAANLCYNYRKRLLIDKRVVNELSVNASADHDDVHEGIDLKILKDTIQRAISLLSPQRKKLYQLHRNQGLSVPEIAREVSLSINTVRNTLSSAAAFIRSYLRQSGYDMDDSS